VKAAVEDHNPHTMGGRELEALDGDAGRINLVPSGMIREFQVIAGTCPDRTVSIWFGFRGPTMGGVRKQRFSSTSAGRSESFLEVPLHCVGSCLSPTARRTAILRAALHLLITTKDYRLTIKDARMIQRLINVLDVFTRPQFTLIKFQ